MTKLLQIHIEESELALVKEAASRAGRPLAQWAREILCQEAREQLGQARLDAHSALDALFSLDAPIDDVQTMIEESVAGRLR